MHHQGYATHAAQLSPDSTVYHSIWLWLLAPLFTDTDTDIDLSSLLLLSVLAHISLSPGKNLLLHLDEPVLASAAVVQRLQGTGALVITMPRAEPPQRFSSFTGDTPAPFAPASATASAAAAATKTPAIPINASSATGAPAASTGGELREVRSRRDPKLEAERARAEAEEAAQRYQRLEVRFAIT